MAQSQSELVPELSELPYEDRLKAFKLTPLEERRIRGDAIETFKIMRDLEDVDPSKFFTPARQGNLQHTRGHPLKLEARYSKTE